MRVSTLSVATLSLASATSGLAAPQPKPQDPPPPEIGPPARAATPDQLKPAVWYTSKGPQPRINGAGHPTWPAEAFKIDSDGLPTKDIADYLAWECKHHYGGLWDVFLLNGRNWGSNEKEIKDTCKKAGIVTEWEYDGPDEGEGDVFSVKFRLPVKSTRRLEKKLDKLLGIKHGGVRCPKVPEKEFHFDHYDFHFNGYELDQK